MGQKIVTKLRKYSSSQRHRVNSVAYCSPVPGRRFCNDTARINEKVPLSLANFQSATYPSTASPMNIVFLTMRCMLKDNWIRRAQEQLLVEKKLFLDVIARSRKSCYRLHASADTPVQSSTAQLHRLLYRAWIAIAIHDIHALSGRRSYKQEHRFCESFSILFPQSR
jgi:hypothetical protein